MVLVKGRRIPSFLPHNFPSLSSFLPSFAFPRIIFPPFISSFSFPSFIFPLFFPEGPACFFPPFFLVLLFPHLFFPLILSILCCSLLFLYFVSSIQITLYDPPPSPPPPLLHFTPPLSFSFSFPKHPTILPFSLSLGP